MRTRITRFIRRCVSGVFPLFLLMKPLISPGSAAAFAICSLACALAPAQAGESVLQSYDIAPGDAASTLKRFADESGRQVVFLVDAVRGVTTNPVRGEYTVREALTRLVAETGLVVAEDAKSGALMVNRLASREPPTQPQPRPQAIPMKTRSLFTAISSWLAVASASFAPAQSANAPAAAAAPGSVVTLSPFEVSSDRDVGYAAQETLSGTRLRTSLRDVGASLAVLTPEFLADLGIHSFDQALQFTPSVDTVQGDNESDFNAGNLRFGNGQQISLRGFTAGPSASHDFFPALERNDTYNVEQLTLARGPNAMLFGLGGSAGAVVSGIKRAQFGQRRPTLTLQVDRWGSRRAAVDVNRVVIDDKLAVRINALHSRKQEFRRYEGVDQKRVTVGARWRPFRNTEIVVNHEEYDTGLNLSPLVAPFDVGTLRWIQAGRPTVEFVNDGRAWTTAGRTFVDAAGRPVPRPGGNGVITSTADFNAAGGLLQLTTPTLRYVVGLDLPNPVVNYQWQSNLNNSLFGGVAAGTNHSLLQADPWNLFGLPKDANLFPGTWDNPARGNRGRWTALFIDQRLAPGLHFEIAGNLGRDRTLLSTDALHILRIDVDRYLPDGRLNPGYLVPYAESNGGGQYRRGLSESMAGRATLSYEYDLKRVHRWLGRQSLSGLYQWDQTASELDNHRILNRTTAGLSGYATDVATNTHQLWPRVYYPNGRVPDPLPDLFQIENAIPRINSLGNAVGATAAERVPNNYALYPFLAAVKTKNVVESASFAWIGRFLGDRLVTTTGVRRDQWKLYGIPVVRELADSRVANSANDRLRRYYTRASAIPFNSAPAKTESATNSTFGAVFRTTNWLDLTFSRSRNFTPTTNAVSTNYLDQISPQRTGNTTDYGVRLFLLDGRLSVAANKFQTRAENETRNAASYTASARNILNRLRSNYKDLGDSHFRTMGAVGDYRVDNSQGLDSTWDYVAEGHELTLTFNPNPRWRVYLSGSSNKNVLGEHLQDLGKYLYTPSEFQGVATWQKFATELRRIAAGQSSNSFDLNPNLATDRAKAATDAAFIETQLAAQVQTWEDELALMGRTTNRNGKYAANGLVTHAFGEGTFLRGFSLGGNFRWRSASIIGYERKTNAAGRPLAVIDVNRPLRGEDYWELGFMVLRQFRFANRHQLKLQLNIDNPFNWDDPRVVASEYDSQGYYGTVDSIVPIRYELRRPRNVTLTASYTF